MSENALDSIDNQIYAWNAKFPIDRWWRDKHNVAFGSKKHREANLIDMLFEYREDQLVRESLEALNNGNKDKYIAGRNDWLKKREISKQEIDDWFDNIEI